MTDIAKIALVGGEITITKHALECYIKGNELSSESKQRYARIINKIEKATKKTAAEREAAKQQGLHI